MFQHNAQGGYTQRHFGTITGASRSCVFYQGEDMDWDISELQSQGDNIKLLQLLLAFNNEAAQGGHFLLMSNGGFSGLYEKLIDQLQ